MNPISNQAAARQEQELSEQPESMACVPISLCDQLPVPGSSFHIKEFTSLPELIAKVSGRNFFFSLRLDDRQRNERHQHLPGGYMAYFYPF